MGQGILPDVGHDRPYKTQAKVPEPLEREVRAVAATLNSVDRALARSVASLDRYLRHFEAYRKPAALEDAIDQWKAVHEVDPSDTEATRQLGRLLMAAQRWNEAYRMIKGLKHVLRAEVQMEIGQAAWRVCPSRVAEARRCLHRAGKLEPRDWRTWCALAATYRSIDLAQAIEYYEKAFSIAPNEPAILAPLVECHLRRDRSLARIDLMQGVFRAARAECHERARRGVFVPQAHFHCARLHLYMGNPYAALNAYCKTVSACHMPKPIREELDALSGIRNAAARRPKGWEPRFADSHGVGFDWAREMLMVVLAAGDQSVHHLLSQFAALPV